MSFDAVDDRGSWRAVVDLRAPLTTGVYEGANTGPLSPTLSVRHSSTSCDTSSGRFTVNDLAGDKAGALASASIDFEQLCAGATEPLYGGVRYKSKVPLVHAFRVTPSTESAAAGSPVMFTGVGSSATARWNTGSWFCTRRLDGGPSYARTTRSTA